MTLCILSTHVTESHSVHPDVKRLITPAQRVVETQGSGIQSNPCVSLECLTLSPAPCHCGVTRKSHLGLPTSQGRLFLSQRPRGPAGRGRLWS